MSLIQATAIPSSGEKDTLTIPYSCRFDANTACYLTRTTTSTGSNYIATLSGWVKRAKLGARQAIFAGWESSTERMMCSFMDNDHLKMQIFSGGVDHDLETNRVFRDPSAWYHLVFQFNTSSGTESERFKMFVNGVQETSFSVDDTIGQNAEMMMWGSTSQYPFIGVSKSSSLGNYFDGYMAEVHFIDGTVVDPSEFGKEDTYGEWLPVEYTGSHGTNGFYLDFADSGDLGDDESANTNDFTENIIAAHDQMHDTPTTNFATLNSIHKDSSVNLHQGNLAHWRSSNMTRPGLSTIALGTGKWYFEMHDLGSGSQCGVQWDSTNVYTYSHYTGSQAFTFNDNGGVYDNGSYQPSGSTSAGSVSSGARIRMIAYDGATGKLWGGANGTWGSSGNPATGANPNWTVNSTYRDKLLFSVNSENSGSSTGVWANFGADSSFADKKNSQGNQDDNGIGDFYYDVPAGFLSLCAANLPTVAVTPSEHFKVITDTVTNGTAITGVGFQPDLLWSKSRSQAYDHALFDAVRGPTNFLRADTTVAEQTPSSGFDLLSFDTDGFTVGNNQYNTVCGGASYVYWNWKAGGGAGSSNTNGSINTTSTSVNTDAGFSISTYTGTGSSATIGHGLSKAPEMIIVKRRDTSGDWIVGHDGLATNAFANNNFIKLEAISGTFDNSLVWGSQPTSTVFQVTTGDAGNLNTSGGTYVAYCFHSVDGYSKVGKYTGNYDANGTFLHTGFKPAWVLFKSTGSSNWLMYSNPPNTSNLAGTHLASDENRAEGVESSGIDFVSNGIKMRNTFNNLNRSNNYIYLAFAETPFKHSNAR